MNVPPNTVIIARDIAATTLRATGRPDLAKMVLNGSGDDLPEVSATTAALTELHKGHDLLKQALQFYADESCWDDELPGGPLTMHDRGEIARAVLAGKDPFHHRD
ncbi:hypothetical protein [Parasphingorhabdus sp.]|uniref:hypothetical protein n=1 Tax=Parasphingorhabdus sp. TaxID=2709688 RepID=UPI003A9039E2